MLQSPPAGGPDPRPTAADQRRRAWATLAILAAIATSFVLGLLVGRSSTPTAPEQAAETAPTSTPTTRPTLPPEFVAKLATLPRRDANDPLAAGSVDAPVVLLEYADYRCPFCGVWARETKPQLQRFVDDGTLRLEYRDTPLFGEQSERAALAARAAGSQGRFWEYYTVVYADAPTSGHADLTQEKLVEYARSADVADIERFERELADGTHRAGLQRDVDEANDLGITSTPLFLINTEPIVGAQPVEVFVDAIERQRDAATS